MVGMKVKEQIPPLHQPVRRLIILLQQIHRLETPFMITRIQTQQIPQNIKRQINFWTKKSGRSKMKNLLSGFYFFQLHDLFNYFPLYIRHLSVQRFTTKNIDAKFCKSFPIVDNNVCEQTLSL